MTVHAVAVSDHAGTLHFETVGTNGGVVEHAGPSTLEVPCVALDGYLPGDFQVDVLKMDLEAHAVVALAGMRNLLARCRPSIVIEWHPWAMEVLLELGYSLAIVAHGVNPIATRNVADIVSHWRGLNSETEHLDLLAAPVKTRLGA